LVPWLTKHFKFHEVDDSAKHVLFLNRQLRQGYKADRSGNVHLDWTLLYCTVKTVHTEAGSLSLDLSQFSLAKLLFRTFNLASDLLLDSVT